MGWRRRWSPRWPAGWEAIRNEVAKDLEEHPKVYGATGEVGLSRPAADILMAAERYAEGHAG